MSIKARITGSIDNLQADVVDSAEYNGLVVRTLPLKTYTNRLKFFINSTYGIDMNKDASVGGTPLNIHDGTDNAYWTASAISGTWVFDSVAQNHTPAGSKSIDGTGTTNGAVAQFAKGGSQSLTGYVSLTIWVYVVNSWASGDVIQVYGWDTGTGTIRGVAVNLGNYFNYSVLGTWQKISIPLANLALTGVTIDAIRIRYLTRSGAAANYYFDDLQFEETGTALEYKVEPAKGTWLHVDRMMIQYADAYAGTLADATMPSVPYNKFFGVAALDSGLVYKRWSSGLVVNSYAIKQHSDLMNFSDATISGCGSDGTNSWVSIKINFAEAVTLKAENEDKLSITISDNLSGLLLLRASVGCKEEARKIA